MLTAHDIQDRLPSTTVAMGVLDTSTHSIAAANQPLADMLGRTMDDIVGLRVDQYVEGERLDAAASVIDAMRQGWMDACEGYVEFRRGDGRSAWAYSWSVPLGAHPPHESLLMGATPTRGDRPPGFDASRADPSRVVLGTLDHDWRFSDITRGTAGLLGWPAGEEGTARLQDIVHPGDVPVLLASLGRAALRQDATTIHVRVKARDDGWLAAGVTVSALCIHATPRFGVAIWLLADRHDGPDLDRMARLEEQLLQLATEVRAGTLTVPMGMTYLDTSGLSQRQTEVVRRLAGGQRVSAIADDLFLSPSTVRNHLSAIYRKLGVSSQFELIEKLRGRASLRPNS